MPEHTLLEQSAARAQLEPSLQAGQLPPQSTSVSLPFLAPSLQLGAWHLAGLPEHTPLVQSPATLHSLPSAHLVVHVSPPQSTSVSPPFLTLSGQPGAWHFFGVPEHTPLEQSLAAAHCSPEPQRAHRLAPPQSTSVSTPFFTTSLQLGT